MQGVVARYRRRRHSADQQDRRQERLPLVRLSYRRHRCGSRSSTVTDATDTTADSRPPVFGLVLAGGKSRRFGSDKAAIEIGGEPLLSRTVKLLDGLCARTFVSVRADQAADALRSTFPLIVDDEHGLGPAGGLIAAHRHDAAAAWLVVACDMPNLDEATLRNLLQSRRTAADATAYSSPRDGEPEPLCAIYEPATLARFARRASEGHSLSPRQLLKSSDVEIVAIDHEAALTNVNAPEDLIDR